MAQTQATRSPPNPRDEEEEVVYYKTTIRMDIELYRRVFRAARADRRSVNQWMVMALEEQLARESAA